MLNPYCMRSMAFLKLLLQPVVEHFVKISSSGIENVPRSGPFILVSNHRSDLDPLVIGAVMPRYIAWIADAFLFNIPVVRELLRLIGTIPISRKREQQLRALRRCRAVINSGQAIGVFPEGHETIVHGSPRKLGKFHGGFAELALRHQIPVLPVTLMPVEEVARPLTIPRFVADWLDLPDDVLETTKRIVYRKVHVEFEKPILPSAYMGQTQNSAETATFRNASAQLIAHTRFVIGDNFRRSVGYR